MAQRFSGLGMSLGNLSRLSDAKSRSISPENFTGEKGRGGMARTARARHARGLGRGWKISPSMRIAPGATFCSADIEGPGAIQQIWMTPAGVRWRDSSCASIGTARISPRSSAPLGDFFACGWGSYAQVTSLAVCVNPGRAFNCYWEMPFRKRARITLENRDPDSEAILYYQINYALTEVPEDAAYFHAQFRRVNPSALQAGLHDPRRGQRPRPLRRNLHGLGRQQLRLVGRGRNQVLLDGDEFPTICGTGTEDYFCGAYNFDAGTVDPSFPRAYVEFTTPYAGLPQVIRPDGLYQSQQRFGLYRWHIMDPIRFESDLRVTIQALGWRTEKDQRAPLSAVAG